MPGTLSAPSSVRSGAEQTSHRSGSYTSTARRAFLSYGPDYTGIVQGPNDPNRNARNAARLYVRSFLVWSPRVSQVHECHQSLLLSYTPCERASYSLQVWGARIKPVAGHTASLNDGNPLSAFFTVALSATNERRRQAHLEPTIGSFMGFHKRGYGLGQVLLTATLKPNLEPLVTSNSLSRDASASSSLQGGERLRATKQGPHTIEA